MIYTNYSSKIFVFINERFYQSTFIKKSKKMDIFFADVLLSDLNENLIDLNENLTERLEECLKHLAELQGIRYANNSVLYAIAELVNSTAYDECDDITIEMTACKYIDMFQCICLQNIPTEDAVKALIHIWKNLNFRYECVNIIEVVKYYVISGEMPGNEELQTYLRNVNHIYSDPIDYCNNKRHDVPTPGINNLVPIKAMECSMCSICQDDIEQGCMVFKLPQCGHIFHSEGCLENESIMSWLKKTRVCPNCNAEISVLPDA